MKFNQTVEKIVDIENIEMSKVNETSENSFVCLQLPTDKEIALMVEIGAKAQEIQIIDQKLSYVISE